MPQIRQPIIAVLGHVDHGKTTLLDRIRGTSVAAREAGAITQHVGATEVPADVVKKICEPLLKKFKIDLKLPGVLFVDTPGHEAFTNLRKRGGALADLVTLVIDIREGFMPQTLESITILKSYKTPFLVAANKIDLIPGWQPFNTPCFLESCSKQTTRALQVLDEKIYEIVGKLHELGFESERFDRITDFRRQVCIVPVSAKTGEGIAELLALLFGLAQRFLEEHLRLEVSGNARGTVLEVKEEIGLGKTLDVILYDGSLRVGDWFLVGGVGRPIISRVRAILRPKPLDEIRDPEDKFRSVKEVHAAAGIKIAAPGLEDAIAGVPFVGLSTPQEAEKVWKEIEQEIEKIRIRKDTVGLVVKADALGSLEAIENVLSQKNVPIRIADIGEVSRRDVIEASSVQQTHPLFGVILAFNVRVLEEAREAALNLGVDIIEENVIYRLIEKYDEWCAKKKEEIKRKQLEGFVRPAKFVVKAGYVFRRSEPAIVGISVLGGVLLPKSPVMRQDGKHVGRIKELQKEKQQLSEAKMGDELAVSIEGGIVGRNFDEGDVLYTEIPAEQVLRLKSDLKDLLSGDELAVLEEIIAIKQKIDKTYGVM
ncbi:MAG: translation initiation factor IF-2 [Candidatus Hadarchaeales archaeon]